MSERLRITVADDDPAVRAFLCLCLTRLGHSVAQASNGDELVERCRETPPDVVLSDVDMPGQDGIAAAAVIRRFSTAPIILISGRWDEAKKVRADRAGVTHVLRKPFAASELADVIRQCRSSSCTSSKGSNS